MNTLDLVFRTMLDTSWRASWLILLVFGLRACFRPRLAAQVIFGAWIIVALRLLVPVSIPAAWSPFNLAKSTAITDWHSNPVAITAGTGTAVVPPISLHNGVEPEPVSRPGKFAWATLVWGAGVIAMLALRIGALVSFARRLRQADTQVVPWPAEITGGLDTRGIPLLVTNAVRAPVLHGVFRPRILIPPGLSAALKPEALRLTIAHELAHARRRDLLVEAVMHLAVTLHWFNPLAWLAARQARRDCELACDERVLRGAGDVVRQCYGSTLLQVARMVSATPPAFALGVVGSRGQVRERIETLLANRPFTFWSTLFGSTVCGVLTILSFTSQSAAQPQPSIAPRPPPRAAPPVGVLPTAWEFLEAAAPPATPGVTVTAPPGWWKNGRNPENYVAGVDSTQTRGGMPSSYVRSIREATGSFGGMMQTTPAENYLGKRVRVTAWVKTEDANDGGGHLWLRVDGQERGRSLRFDNMDNRPIKGTTDWQEASVVLDVPQEARALAYGFFVSGNGKMWVSAYTLSEVGLDVPVTDEWIRQLRGNNRN